MKSTDESPDLDFDPKAHTSVVSVVRVNTDTQRTIRDGLDEYRRGVETLMRLRSPQIISNSEPIHAAILFDVFFKNAVQHVKIFCKSLRQDVFAHEFVLASAIDAVARHVNISILLQDAHPDRTPFSDWACRENGVMLLRTDSQLIRNADFNFTSMDDFAYRFEEHRNLVRATASMNLPKVAKVFADKFEAFIALPHTRLGVSSTIPV
jgi:hypothetical protein